MRQRKRVGAFSVLALIASLVALFVGAPPANAASATSLVRCTNTFSPAITFNLPIELETTVTDISDNPISSVDEGEQFKVTAQATIPLSEGFIAGVLAQVPSLTQIDIPRVHIAIPPPSGATGPDLTFDYAPGTVNITSAPGVPIAGGVPLPSAPQTETYLTTGVGGSNVDFVLDPAVAGTPEAQTAGGTIHGAGGLRAAIELDLAIFGGAVAVGFDCTDGGLTQDPGLDTVLGTPDDQFVLPVIPNAPFLAVPINAPLVPTVNVDSVSGQVVDDAARPGNVISFSGPNWSPSSAITVQLCDLLLTTCSAAQVSSVSASIDGGGVLSGQATVAAGATTGARALRVSTDQSESDDIQVRILGAPTITAPLNAGVGAPIAISGTNWNPNSPSTIVVFTSATGTPVAAPVSVAVDDDGEFSTVQTVVPGIEIVAAGDLNPAYPQPPSPLNPGSLSAISPFSVSANSCTVPTGGDCSIQQTLLLTTNPGTLSMSQDSGVIDLGDFDLDGTAHVVPGAINEITTVDATGSLNGWDLTATMTDLTTDGGGGNKTIPAGNLEWAPSCDPIDANSDGIVDGSGAEVASGIAAALDTTIARTLCTAAAGGGGGTFTGNAGFDLLVPANVAAGDYTATITFLLM